MLHGLSFEQSTNRYLVKPKKSTSSRPAITNIIDKWKQLQVHSISPESKLSPTNLPVESSSKALTLSVWPLSFMVLEPLLGSQTRTTYRKSKHFCGK